MLWALVKKELIALSRDINGIVALFVMPMIFIVIMSLALKNVYDPPVNTLVYSVQNLDDSSITKDLLKEWEGSHGKAQVLPEDWQVQVQKGQLDYVLLIEKGFSKQIIKDKVKDGVYIRFLAKPQIDVGAFNANKASLNMMVNQIRAQALFELAKAKQMRPSTADVDVTATDMVFSERLSNGAKPTAVQQNVPAWLMFGMFFVLASISNLFIQERESGALTRLASLGVPISMMMLSKALPYFLVNGVQAALMLAVGVWLMPLLGGDALSLSGINWTAFMLILFAISAAAIGLALTLACVSRTHAQASAIGPVLNVLMAAIGGVMVPTFVMPEVMQNASSYSPMNWGLNGMLAVLLNRQGVADVWPHAEKLLIFAALMFVLAMVLFKRRVK